MDALHRFNSAYRASCNGVGVGVVGVTDILKEYWALVIGAISGLAWLMRLESRGLANEHEILLVSKQMDKDQLAAKESRAEMRDSLDEIRRDIKKLLEQH